ncbi:hypothetical protein FRACYDRAFT_250464 [Fragilariopsis cylindrus CCMP1102]|uniref:Uncharacterized protein n=1 Tax=Fragilariopsis cylindrus CCMP1102 TaxID=635003 RepID=A0A1E7EPF0_9STRA|nr:hypothetical protein FRACYDRAFT_250464 [Fragilariopsis cylindrus CCMP1102]|eukprot:OEU07840.1 hypothetical protein FRACYDRAFT_250464 [Fragilariopsis cylindrus CCMP1102]
MDTSSSTSTSTTAFIDGYNPTSPTRRRRTRTNWNKQLTTDQSLASVSSSSSSSSSSVWEYSTTSIAAAVVELSLSSSSSLRTRTKSYYATIYHNIINADNENNENNDETIYFLTFGGPPTWGRETDDVGNEAAYPYLLSSSSSSSSYVRNVVQSQYENGGSGPTFASLCTQSIIEEQDDDDGNGNDSNNNKKNYNKYKKTKTASRSSTLIGNRHDNDANDDLSSSNNSDIVFDVITLEYYEYETTVSTTTKVADTNDANANVFSSSMQLLAKRLRLRYPFATIIYIKLWTPLDLIYYDPISNRTISFTEWRMSYQQNQQQNQNQKQTLIEAMKEHTWTFRRDLLSTNDNYEQQQKRQQQENSDLKTTMDTVDGIIYEMFRPTDINDSLEIIQDWFYEEEEENEEEETIDSNGDSDDNNKSLRYTLSREGHAIIAKDLRGILNDPTAIRKRKNNYYSSSSSSSSPTLSTALTSPPPSSSKQQQQQLLGSWGSGDSCQIWYDTGKNSLPDHHFEYSKGLKLIEFHPNRYALEVQDGGGGDATLRVYNPFDEDRMVYISYMTTSATAAANKVYPKTKVRIQQQQQQQQQQEKQKPVLEGSTSKMRLASSSLLSSSSNTIILDPSHDDNNDNKHRMRTTAIGFVSANSTGILDFTPLEEYTVYNFRLVGVSFLVVQEKKKKVMTHNNNVPSEFAISPRRLSVKSAITVDEIDDDDETTKTNK